MNKADYLERFKDYSDEVLEGMLKTGNYNAEATAAIVEILGGTNKGVDYQALAVESQKKAIKTNHRIRSKNTNIVIAAIVSFIFWKIVSLLYLKVIFVAMVDSVGLERARELSDQILSIFVVSILIGFILYVRSSFKRAKQEAIEDGEIELTPRSPDSKI